MMNNEPDDDMTNNVAEAFNSHFNSMFRKKPTVGRLMEGI